jgi:hypothetical protein
VTAPGRPSRSASISLYAATGNGGNETTTALIVRLRRHGATEEQCFELVTGGWNDTCEPPWTTAELRVKVRSIYGNPREPVGVRLWDTSDAGDAEVDERGPDDMTADEELAACEAALTSGDWR